jgi:hypothetical protein
MFVSLFSVIAGWERFSHSSKRELTLQKQMERYRITILEQGYVYSSRIRIFCLWSAVYSTYAPFSFSFKPYELRLDQDNDGIPSYLEDLMEMVI